MGGGQRWPRQDLEEGGAAPPLSPFERPRQCHVPAQALAAGSGRGGGEPGAAAVVVAAEPGRACSAAMNFLRGVMGAQSAGPQPSGAETVSVAEPRRRSRSLSPPGGAEAAARRPFCLEPPWPPSPGSPRWALPRPRGALLSPAPLGRRL